MKKVQTLQTIINFKHQLKFDTHCKCKLVLYTSASIQVIKKVLVILSFPILCYNNKSKLTSFNIPFHSQILWPSYSFPNNIQNWGEWALEYQTDPTLKRVEIWKQSNKIFPWFKTIQISLIRHSFVRNSLSSTETMKSEIQTGLRLKTKTREIVSTTFWY